MTEQPITTFLRDVRTRSQATQEQLADAVGVSRQTIISIEKGNYTPSVLLALRIAHYFNVPVEDIFAYEG
ncbi:helix-turn-helix transcriptional regulator [Candidatus Kaiserbacteria bacterium]|nr:MAG: helix-turn-helix transcriptional regulator [Candidatus Kaiserbacteria bacterium]